MDDGDLTEEQRGEWRVKMDKDMTTMKEGLGAVKGDVSEIKNAIIGNSKYRQLGIMERMEKAEAWQTNATLRVMFLAGAISGAAEVLKYFLKH